MSPQSSVPIQVLLVSDYRIVLWGLERLIESAGRRFSLTGSTTSCASAMKLLEQAAPDVIVLDLEGGGVIGEIPQLIAKSRAKILAVTGSRDIASHDRAVLAGARGVVGRDALADALLTAIEKIHQGQLWLDRAAAGRIFMEFSRKSSAAAVDPERLKISTLTAREREVIAVMSADANAPARAIAEKLRVSEHTLRNHLTSIYDKLGVGSRLALFAFAQEFELNHNINGLRSGKQN